MTARATQSPRSRPYTLVWDGACPVCRALAGLVGRWDRHHRIEAVPYQRPGVMERFPWIPRRAFSESVQLVGPDDSTWEGADAIRRLLHLLPGGGMLAWAFEVPILDPAIRRFYRWFSRNRYRFR